MPKEVGDIFDAIKDGNLDSVRSILAADPTQVNAKDQDGTTPLHEAAGKGQTEVAGLLIDKGANVNASTGGFWSVGATTPLHFAARMGQIEVAELLLNNGAQVNAKSAWRDTPLHWAANWGDIETVKVLIDNGADVNAKDDDGKTPAECAARKDRDAIALLLLKHGAKN